MTFYCALCEAVDGTFRAGKSRMRANFRYARNIRRARSGTRDSLSPPRVITFGSRSYEDEITARALAGNTSLSLAGAAP